MDPLVTSSLTILAAFIASSGFWAYLTRVREKKSATARLLMGLAHDKILHLGMNHIRNGYISKEDYDDLRHYLYEPYLEMGGNGTVERVMREVSNLPLRIQRLPLTIEKEECND